MKKLIGHANVFLQLTFRPAERDSARVLFAATDRNIPAPDTVAKRRRKLFQRSERHGVQNSTHDNKNNVLALLTAVGGATGHLAEAPSHETIDNSQPPEGGQRNGKRKGDKRLRG